MRVFWGGKGQRMKEQRRRRVLTNHVNQHIQRLPFPLLDELRRVMFGPLGLVVRAEVASEGLAAPVAVARVGDGGEGGHGSVLAGVFEEL